MLIRIDVVRPNIYMFGDNEWDQRRSNAQETEYYKFKNNIKEYITISF